MAQNACRTYLFAVHDVSSIVAGMQTYTFAAKNPGTYTGGQEAFQLAPDQTNEAWDLSFRPNGDFAFWATFVNPCDPTGVTLTGKTSRKSVRVAANAKAAHGPTIRYSVVLANTNTNKTSSFDKAGLVVTLPAGTTYVKASVSPRLANPGSKPDKALSTPVYDAGANTVTWPDVPLSGGRKRKYTVVAKVQPTAVTPLLFQAAGPSCPALATDSSVTVRCE